MGLTRKHLSKDGLLDVVRQSVRREKLEELKHASYSWQDCIMSSLAIFGFKLVTFAPSVRDEKSIRAIYPAEFANTLQGGQGTE